MLPERAWPIYRAGMERVRFGTYDFLPSTGELRREGRGVRLQAQPARVLAALVARPGELVGRETLQREVWGEGTHVDFERGLNFCIAQVRAALGDSADHPLFIETVPKQGYRFIAPILPERPAEGSASVPSPASSRGVVLTLALSALVMLAAGAAWNRAAMPPPTVIVVPFYNETGRPDLDPLARSIGDATVARLASAERIPRLSVIGNAPSLANPFARQAVQGIALKLDAQFVVIGQLKSDGAGLRLIAHLVRAADMRHVWASTFDDPSFTLPAQRRVAEETAAAVTAAVRQGQP
jgi:DNA-binding winged helix-turn-helix (wHTH) protein/TolB-like protein